MSAGELLMDTTAIDALKDTDVAAWVRAGGVPEREINKILRTLNIKRSKDGGGVSCGSEARKELALGVSYILNSVVQNAITLAGNDHDRRTISDADCIQGIQHTDLQRLYPNLTVAGLVTPPDEIINQMQNSRLGQVFKKSLQDRQTRLEEGAKEVSEDEAANEDQSGEEEESVSSQEDSDDEVERKRQDKHDKKEKAKEKKDKGKGKGKKGKKAKKGKGKTKGKKEKKASSSSEEESEPVQQAQEIVPEAPEEESVAERAKKRGRKRPAEAEPEPEVEGRRYSKKQRKETANKK